MINLTSITVGPWEMNCYLLADEGSGSGFLIDPGDEAGRILDWLGSRPPTKILITHADQDHIGALEAVRSTLRVPVGIHPLEAERSGIQADFGLVDGLTLDLAGHPLEVAHIPGHTPGSVALYLPDGAERPLAVVGDAVFPRGPGHTNSPQDLGTAIDALARTVFTWPDETVLHPGHGDPTTVGAERESFQSFSRRPLPLGLYGDVTWR